MKPNPKILEVLKQTWIEPCDYITIRKILNEDNAKVEWDDINGCKMWFLVHKEGVIDILYKSNDIDNKKEAEGCASLLILLWHVGLPIDLARDLACSYWDNKIGRKVNESY